MGNLSVYVSKEVAEHAEEEGVSLAMLIEDAPKNELEIEEVEVRSYSGFRTVEYKLTDVFGRLAIVIC